MTERPGFENQENPQEIRNLAEALNLPESAMEELGRAYFRFELAQLEPSERKEFRSDTIKKAEEDYLARWANPGFRADKATKYASVGEAIRSGRKTNEKNKIVTKRPELAKSGTGLKPLAPFSYEALITLPGKTPMSALDRQQDAIKTGKESASDKNLIDLNVDTQEMRDRITDGLGYPQHMSYTQILDALMKDLKIDPKTGVNERWHAVKLALANKLGEDTKDNTLSDLLVLEIADREMARSAPVRVKASPVAPEPKRNNGDTRAKFDLITPRSQETLDEIAVGLGYEEGMKATDITDRLLSEFGIDTSTIVEDEQNPLRKLDVLAPGKTPLSELLELEIVSRSESPRHLPEEITGLAQSINAPAPEATTKPKEEEIAATEARILQEKEQKERQKLVKLASALEMPHDFKPYDVRKKIAELCKIEDPTRIAKMDIQKMADLPSEARIAKEWLKGLSTAIKTKKVGLPPKNKSENRRVWMRAALRSLGYGFSENDSSMEIVEIKSQLI